MVVVTNFGALRFTLYDVVTADVALQRIFILLLLSGTQAFHRLIRPENRHNLRFLEGERVKKLGEHVFSHFIHSQLVKVIITRGENGRCSAHFVLLGVSGPFNLAIGGSRMDSNSS